MENSLKPQRILLLNPPFPDRLSRDYATPHTYKSDYAWPAIELVAISGILADLDLTYIDAIQEQGGVDSLLARIRTLAPAYIFMMVSSISEKTDFDFIRALRKVTSAKIALLGDIVSFDYERLVPSAEGDYLIRDFTNAEAIRSIALGHRDEKLTGFSGKPLFSIGVPRHDLFMRYEYYYPYSLHNYVAPVLTNYGCPFKCRFCNSGQLEFKTREPAEVVAELHALKKAGVKEIFFKDFTFLAAANRQLLEYMIDNNLDFAFSCSPRVDTIDTETLRLLKRAGCFLLFYGPESGSQATHDQMAKGFTKDQIRATMKATKSMEIETLNSFIIGFPHETAADIKETARFIFELDPDYLSLNVLVARHGADIRSEIPDDDHQDLDISRSRGVKTIDGIRIDEFRKSIERKFYFRPRKLVRFMRLALKSPFRIKSSVKQLLGMIRRTL